MWARKCGAPPQWPSRVKVLLQSFMTAAVGFAVYQWMSGADLGYLDLSKPQQQNVLCVTEWPLRHDANSWWSLEMWEDWFSYREDMSTFVNDHKCVGNHSSMNEVCSTVDIPLYQMDRNLGIPLGLDEYAWRNDVIEIYGHLFLWMTVCLWVVVTTHDMALLTVSKRDYIYDLRGIRNNFRCCSGLYKLLGFRCWKRLLRGGGIKVGSDKRVLRKLGKIIAIPLAPLFFAWAIGSFFCIVIPVVAIFFIIFPVRLSRALIFLNCVAIGIEGVVLALHSIAFIASVDERQMYAVTWERTTTENTSCICGCMYPITQSRSWNLLFLGVVVAYKSFNLAFRCLKGLRRSNWANLMSVMFPIPLTAYEVKWTRPDGSPIQHRVPGQPVQAEMAFDAFALMDEQIDSHRTTVSLIPSAISPSFEPMFWSTTDVGNYLEELGYHSYSKLAVENDIDGPTLLQLCRRGEDLAEIGCTNKVHASKIRGKLGTYDANGAKKPGDFADNSRLSVREISGPKMLQHNEVAAEHRRYEYIGCCGFPCRRGENGSKYMGDDSEEDLPEGPIIIPDPNANKEEAAAPDVDGSENEGDERSTKL
mmetsp:Transcript_95997/g.200531  ORF Transcript_95997/g.200531 Transcript_95997/m.200531 type:complete len:589 (-) Transcript_95997:107-1873(-)